MNEDQRQKLIREGKEKLAAAEAEKRMLYDRQIGGASAPRPTVAYIKENVGKQRTQAEIDKAATAHVYPKMKDKAADLWVVKNAATEKRTAPEKLREAWQTKNPEAPKKTAPEKLREVWKGNVAEPAKRSSPEQLRQAWNAKEDPSRAKQRGQSRDRGGQER